jgi:hypothetical protein
MVNPVTLAQQTEPTTASAAQAKPAANSATSNQKATQSQTSSSTHGPVDTVQISTAAQTAHEAAGGDHQAQRLLAKEAAAEKG